MATILGLDLGKFKSVACLYDPKTQEARYSTIATDPDVLRGFLAAHRPDLVAFETRTVAGRVADACSAVGSQLGVPGAGPARVTGEGVRTNERRAASGRVRPADGPPEGRAETSDSRMIPTARDAITARREGGPSRRKDPGRATATVDGHTAS
jgi:hypothetical protein